MRPTFFRPAFLIAAPVASAIWRMGMSRFLLARAQGQVAANFIGTYADLLRNWFGLLAAAKHLSCSARNT